MSETVYLSNVRLSFPNLIQPQKDTVTNGKYRFSYNAELLLSEDHKGLQDFMNRVGEIAEEKWKDHAQDVMNMIGQDRKQRCYGKGSEKVNKKTFQPYTGYAGNVYITAGCTTILDTPEGVVKRPQIIQPDGSSIDSDNTMAYQQLTRKMYGGCYVNAAVKPWCQDNSHGRGIRCDLVAIQFLADGEAFGGGTADASDMFGAVAQPAQTTAPAEDMGLPPFMK